MNNRFWDLVFLHIFIGLTVAVAEATAAYLAVDQGNIAASLSVALGTPALIGAAYTIGWFAFPSGYRAYKKRKAVNKQAMVMAAQGKHASSDVPSICHCLSMLGLITPIRFPLCPDR